MPSGHLAQVQVAEKSVERDELSLERLDGAWPDVGSAPFDEPLTGGSDGHGRNRAVDTE
jgi:hypothetical protein